MKTKSIYFVLAAMIAVLFSSCAPDIKGELFGETDYYSDFPFYEYEPKIMTRTLEFDFNEYAQDSLTNAIVFEIIKKIENGRDIPVSADSIKLYKDGIPCPDNLLRVKPTEKSVELGIEFTKNAREGNHTLYLRVKDAGGLDRIDNTEISESNSIVLEHEWTVVKKDIPNPLALRLFWILVVIATIIILAIIISRLNTPTFKMRELRIEYYTPEGEFRSTSKLPLKGCYKAILNNTKPKQSVFNKIFKGKMEYKIDGFWEKEITLLPKSNSKNTVRIERNPYDSLVKTISKGTPTEFINSNNEKVIFNF
ncbi:MAG: hypothetical protein LBJ72_06385 [Dysgonamonadaceae bacterium]|nr:hypothetical protein [Dysgonamonadaceae bacterium]